MTVILPGMTEDDQRVKISSADPKQQGILDLWKMKVSQPATFKYILLILFSPEHGQHSGAAQQDARVER